MDHSLPSRDESSKHVARTLRALELLAKRPLSQAELARELGVHPRTARRLLNALVVSGYVMRDLGSRAHFTATLKVVSLSGHVMDRLDIARAAEPFVARLSALTGSTAYLSVPADDSVVCLVETVSDHDGDAGNGARDEGTGTRHEARQLHASADGKVVLSQSPSRVTTVLAQPLESFTEQTISDPADLLVELARVRDDGYAVDDLEGSSDSRGVAAPVFDYSGHLLGILGVIGSPTVLVRDDLPYVGELLRGEAQQLSELLGFDPGRRPVARQASRAQS